MVRLGEQISQLRRDFMVRLQPYWSEVSRELTDLEVELYFSKAGRPTPRWPRPSPRSRDRDVARGITHAGAHRADIVVRLEKGLARETLSRGQQKLIAAAMTLAQLNLIRDLTGTIPTLLLDDPAAELDRSRLARFVDQVRRLQCQLDRDFADAGDEPFGQPDTVFHVEQGELRPV